MLPRKKKVLVGEQRWGQREDVGDREKEDDKRKKWRGSGEKGEKKSGEPEGENGNICYDNRKILKLIKW